MSPFCILTDIRKFRGGGHITASVQMLNDIFGELGLSYHVTSRDKTETTRFGGKHLYPLGYLARLTVFQLLQPPAKEGTTTHREP